MTVKSSCLSRGLGKCGYHVCILGIIGSGKTTLAEQLQKILEEKYGRCEGLWEPVENNPILPLYYQDPKRYAFAMQIYMLNKRLEQQHVAQNLALSGACSVQDSSVFGDSCFVEMLRKDGTMTQEESDIYSNLFINMSRDFMYPSLVVYLDCNPDIALKRIEKRGRECEKDIPVKYLLRLKEELDQFIDEFGMYTHIMRIDANKDLTASEIAEEAKSVVEFLEQTRENPRISRIGV